MSYHHVAIATRDMVATHQFYTDAMGFELVRVEKARSREDAWAKHFFYDTGNGEMMAFWELHDDQLDPNFPTSISEGLGLPRWTNHIAFGVESVNDLDVARQRIVQAGHDVMEIDHHWCKSIYVTDPNDIMVEFCVTTKAFEESDKQRALDALTSDDLAEEPAPIIKSYAGASTD